MSKWIWYTYSQFNSCTWALADLAGVSYSFLHCYIILLLLHCFTSYHPHEANYVSRKASVFPWFALVVMKHQGQFPNLPSTTKFFIIIITFDVAMHLSCIGLLIHNHVIQQARMIWPQWNMTTENWKADDLSSLWYNIVYTVHTQRYYCV